MTARMLWTLERMIISGDQGLVTWSPVLSASTAANTSAFHWCICSRRTAAAKPLGTLQQQVV
eukprot:3722365-Pyramimonas_sp.AAC.1